MIDKKWRVKAESAIDVPLPAGAVWGQMRDWRRFITRDPLHRSVRVAGRAPGSATPRGTRIVIEHRLLGIGPNRVGRILRWREGSGYVFSDLSKRRMGRGMRSGFPHVCSYEVDALTEDTCRVTAGVRGIWTATWIPRWMARAWIWWVLRGTEVCLANELAAYARWRRRKTPAIG